MIINNNNNIKYYCYYSYLDYRTFYYNRLDYNITYSIRNYGVKKNNENIHYA
jgi:hypothetical protein